MKYYETEYDLKDIKLDLTNVAIELHNKAQTFKDKIKTLELIAECLLNAKLDRDEFIVDFIENIKDLTE